MKSPLNNERGAILVFELILLALVIGVTGVAIYQGYKSHTTSHPAAAAKPHTVTPKPTPDPMTGWLTYKSSYEGLSFKYPPDWKLAVSTQQVTGWTDVDTVTVTSKSGFVLTLFTHVQGLGGACGPSSCSYVQTLFNEPMPHVSNAYYIEREIRDADNKTVEYRQIGVKAVTDPTNQYDVIPEVGTVQQFPYYLIFPSHGVDRTAASFIGSYPSGSAELQVPTADFFKLLDVKNGRQIIESATY